MNERKDGAELNACQSAADGKLGKMQWQLDTSLASAGLFKGQSAYSVELLVVIWGVKGGSAFAAASSALCFSALLARL